MTPYTISPYPRSEFEPSPRWVRVYFNSQLIADSRNMMLLRETNRLPVYFFRRKTCGWTVSNRATTRPIRAQRAKVFFGM